MFKLTTSQHQALLRTQKTNLKSKDFNHYPFVTYIYVTYINLTEIVLIFNCHEVTATQLTTFVTLYFL